MVHHFRAVGFWWHALNCCHVCCQGDCSRMCNVNSHYAHLFSTLQGRYHHRFSLGSLAITAAPWWIQRVSQNVVLTEFLLLLLWSSRMERILKESHGAWWGWRKFWWCCCLIVKDGEDIAWRGFWWRKSPRGNVRKWGATTLMTSILEQFWESGRGASVLTTVVRMHAIVGWTWVSAHVEYGPSSCMHMTICV